MLYFLLNSASSICLGICVRGSASKAQARAGKVHFVTSGSSEAVLAQAPGTVAEKDWSLCPFLHLWTADTNQRKGKFRIVGVFVIFLKTVFFLCLITAKFA